MYTLYFSPGSCALAIHALLNELEQKFEAIPRSEVKDFAKISPTMAVPILKDGDFLVQEGAAIALYLMEKHQSPFLPKDFQDRSNAIQWMMFANATVHPSYSKMFFVKKNMDEGTVKEDTLMKAGAAVTKLWDIVEQRLADNKFIAGDKISMADLMLAVYANWNNYFPGKVQIGPNATRLVREVSSRPAFAKAIEHEKIKFNV